MFMNSRVKMATRRFETIRVRQHPRIKSVDFAKLSPAFFFKACHEIVDEMRWLGAFRHAARSERPKKLKEHFRKNSALRSVACSGCREDCATKGER